MIRHIVVIHWSEQPDEKKLQLINEGFKHLSEQIPEIQNYFFTPDLGFNKNNADYVVIGDFKDEKDFKSYVNHPLHLKFVEEVTGPILGSYHSCQFEIPES